MMRARLFALVTFAFILLVGMTIGQSDGGVIEPIDESND